MTRDAAIRFGRSLTAAVSRSVSPWLEKKKSGSIRRSSPRMPPASAEASPAVRASSIASSQKSCCDAARCRYAAGSSPEALTS